MSLDYVFMPAIILVVGALILGLSCRRVLSLSALGQRNGWQRIERLVLLILIVLAAAVTAANTFNTITIWSLRPHDMPSGNIYLVDGYRVHMDCTGTGSPTLVLESGWGSEWLVWSKVQPTLSQVTRVCSYDRAGYGFSDPRPAPRDADHVATELHSLLLQANVTGPIVLVGHSLGGVFIREYATRYPQGVVGLVFVDAVTPTWELGNVNAPPPWISRLVFRMACSTNARVVVGACSWPRPGSSPPGWEMAAESLCHPQFCAIQPEGDSLRLSGEQTAHTGPYNGIPVLIFSHDPGKTIRPRNWENAWTRMQQDLMTLSPRSRRIVVTNSSHMIQLDRPDLISREVMLFIQQIRGAAPQSMNYGSTIKE